MEIENIRSEIKAAAKEAFQELWHQLREGIREDLRQHCDFSRSERSDKEPSRSDEILTRTAKGDVYPVSTGSVSLKSLARNRECRETMETILSRGPMDFDVDKDMLIQPQDALEIQMSPEYALLGKDRTSSKVGFHTRLRALVKSAGFEHSVGVLVLMNSVLIGMETSYQASVPLGTKLPRCAEVADAGFCIFFIAEMLGRIWAYGRAFFNWNEDGFKWNIMDCFLVTLMLIDHSAFILTCLNISTNYSVLRILSLARMLRISRAVRVFHLFDELKTMVSSMAESISSLMSALFLLLIMIYVFGIFFMQIILNNLDMTETPPLSRYFGSLALTMLTLFECIVGGISWDDVVEALVSEVSPLMGVFFVVYISAALFAMTNLVTGVLATNVTAKLREDEDQHMADMIRDTFLAKLDGTETHDVNWDTFSAKMETPAMKEYLQMIDVHVSEAKGLFDLLDEDGDGTIDGGEIVRGFMKLRGPAKAFELSLLARKVNDIHRDLVKSSYSKRYMLNSRSRLKAGVEQIQL